jgi:hypothetical protein
MLLVLHRRFGWRRDTSPTAHEARSALRPSPYPEPSGRALIDINDCLVPALAVFDGTKLGCQLFNRFCSPSYRPV